MIILFLYFTLLFVAPQLWVEPFVGMRVDYFLYPVWLAYCAATGRFGRLFRLDGQDRFFLLMLVWFLLSMVVKGWGESSPQIVGNYIKWFLLYRLIMVTVADVARLRVAAAMLVFFGGLLAVESVQHMYSADGLGWAGQAFGWIDESAAQIGLDKRTRWINIFDGPGVFCVVFTIALPFVLYYTGAAYTKLTRALALPLLSLLLAAIYYTGARGGLITGIAIVGLFFALKTKISVPRLLVGGLLGLALLMVAPGYVTSTTDSHRSAQHRVDMWAQGLEMARFNPVLGVGKGNFKYYSGSLIAHNSAIEIMGETGLVGLFLWIGVIYMAFKKLVLYQLQPALEPRNRACAGGFTLSLVGYLMSSLFVTLEYETYYALLALAGSVGFALPEPARFTVREAFLVCAFIALFFVVLKIFVMMYY